MPRQRKPKVEKDSSERWLLTYADLITLLMIFFTIMYAMSTVNATKFVALEQSLAAALHKSDKIPVNLGSSSLVMSANPTDNGQKSKPAISQTVTVPRDSMLDQLYKQIQGYITKNNLGDYVNITDEVRGVQITMRDIVLFNTGQATILPQAKHILDGLLPFFQQLPNPIVIEGYTDDQPIHTSQYGSNWELSSARSIGVVRYLVGRGVAPNRLSGVGYGQYHPVVPNDTTLHRQMNRRINIVVLREPSITISEITTPISPSMAKSVGAQLNGTHGGR